MIQSILKSKTTIRPRIIPILVLKGARLVKSVRFEDYTYLGDPINAVRIFNDNLVDEIIVADSEASSTNRPPQYEFIEELAGECFMPLTYAGGVSSLESARKLFSVGVQKICVCTASLTHPGLIAELANEFGSERISVALDARADRPGTWTLFGNGGKKKFENLVPREFARTAVSEGAGELIVTSIDREGTQSGFDVDLIREISSAVSVPVIAHGGAGSMNDFRLALAAGATGVASASMFSFFGRKKAVLFSYPSELEIIAQFSE